MKATQHLGVKEKAMKSEKIVLLDIRFIFKSMMLPF